MTPEQAKTVMQLQNKVLDAMNVARDADMAFGKAKEEFDAFIESLSQPTKTYAAAQPDQSKPRRGRPKRKPSPASQPPETSKATAFNPDELSRPSYMDLMDRLNWSREERQKWISQFHGSPEYMRDLLLNSHPELRS